MHVQTFEERVVFFGDQVQVQDDEVREEIDGGLSRTHGGDRGRLHDGHVVLQLCRYDGPVGLPGKAQRLRRWSV